MKRRPEESRLVYTTPSLDASKKSQQFPVRSNYGEQVARVTYEVKKRRGKGVTVIEGLGISEAEMRQLASELKRRHGTGGSVKSKRIEIQGDHRESIVIELRDRGFQVKQAGR